MSNEKTEVLIRSHGKLVICKAYVRIPHPDGPNHIWEGDEVLWVERLGECDYAEPHFKRRGTPYVFVHARDFRAGMILPAPIIKKLHLTDGDSVEIIEDGNRIIIMPSSSKPKYKLADLLKQCDEKATKPSDLKEWDEMQPVGREEL